MENNDGAEEEWEYDERRQFICKYVLQQGEELVWYEKDDRFPGHPKVKKTLRRLENGFTFLVQDAADKVLTVGTAYWVK